MRLLRMLPLVGLLLIGLFWLAGSMLPARKTVSRSIHIERPVGPVYERLNGIEGWKGWFVAPEADARFEGPKDGPGGSMVVAVDDVSMRLRLTETSSPSRIGYVTHPDGDEDGATEGWVHLEPDGDGTEVTWKETGSAHGVSLRWMLYLMGDRMVGSVLERTLHNLKSLMETGRTHVSAETADAAAP